MTDTEAYAGDATAPRVAIQQAEIQNHDPALFTNCGKAKPKAHRIERVAIETSRLMEFCSRRELINQTGHDVWEWPLVILKELMDNALDAAEEAEIPPVITISIGDGRITIQDNGPGIPAKTITGILDYTVRVSSREAYVSPTRGAQGNALKTILAMAFVLDGGRGETSIEAHGIAHRIIFRVDQIRLQPDIRHETLASPLCMGTRVTVHWPDASILKHTKSHFLRMADAYTSINPHLSLRVLWDDVVCIDRKSTNPRWAKWLPSNPTSPTGMILMLWNVIWPPTYASIKSAGEIAPFANS